MKLPVIAFKFIFLNLLLLFAYGICAQNSAIGEWQAHLAFPRAIDVSSCESFTVYAAEEAICYQYHDNNEIRKFDKVNLLSQANPRLLACSPFKDGLVVVIYEDGAIDVLDFETKVHYIRSIADATIIGRRNMQELSFIREDLVLISTDFGVLFFNPIEGIFIEDIRSDVAILDATVFNDNLYFVTEDDVLVLEDYENQATIRNINTYKNLDTLYDNFPLRSPKSAVVFKDELYIGFDDLAVAITTSDSLSYVLENQCASVRDLSTDGDRLAVALDGCDVESVLVSTNGRNFDRLQTGCFSSLTGAVLAPNGRISIAGSGTNGFVYYSDLDSECKFINAGGPFSSDVFDIDVNDNKVLVAAGGISDQNGYTFNFNGVFLLENNTWTNFNNTTREIFGREITDSPAPADFNVVKFSDEDKFYAGAFFEGLVYVDLANPDNDLIYDELNSSLQTHSIDPLRVRIAGVTQDVDGNLWVSNFGAERPLSVKQADGTWFSFGLDNCFSNQDLKEIIVDENTGYVWILTNSNLIVYDTNGTIEDESDDRCRSFNQSNDGLPPADIKSIVLDNNGVMWVGTLDGIGTISCTRNPFDANCNGFRQPVVVDDIPGFFFDGEVIRSMEVDAGNRKWIGTDNGLFLLEPDGNTQLAFFTINNSPLLDNKITALKFDGSTGALWIGTGSGLMSLQTEAQGSNDFRFGEVEVYPQPVRPDYEGPIAIRGLATNANVKITDANGRLVYETEAIGGQAIWDGTDFNKNRVASGVYFVWAVVSNNLSGRASEVAKIAILR